MNAAAKSKTTFYVKSRETLGKKVSQLRQQDKTPGNIYGLNKESQPITVDSHTFYDLYESEGDTGLIYLSIDEGKKKVPVLIDEVEYHPTSGDYQHVVFRRVDLKEKITAEVPIELVGENEVPGAAVITVRDNLQVRALPADLPDKFEVDISTLEEFGDAVTIEDLVVDPDKIELIMTGETELDSPVVLLQEIKEEPEEEEEEVSVEDVELVGEDEEEVETEVEGEVPEEAPAEEAEPEEFKE